MVRLVATDFPSKAESEAFYLANDFEDSSQIFTYDKFKKNSVYLSPRDITKEIYSLNLLSKKYLAKNQILVYVSDSDYLILFNHKTVYSAKINQNFITDDMIKSILITKHIAMLSSGGKIDKYYYVITSLYRSAVENILKQNTKNEKDEEIASCLGDVNELVKNLNPLESNKTHYGKMAFLGLFIVAITWIELVGLEVLTQKYIYTAPIDKLKRELKIEKRLVHRQKIIFRTTNKKYSNLTKCMTPQGVIK